MFAFVPAAASFWSSPKNWHRVLTCSKGTFYYCRDRSFSLHGSIKCHILPGIQTINCVISTAGTTGKKKNQFILQCVCKSLVTQSNPSIVVYVHLYFPDFLCNTLSPPQVEPPQSQQWCRLRGKCHLQAGEPSTTTSLTVRLCLPCVSL